MSDNGMPPWWLTTPMHEMSPQQWESLCDNCGKCCLSKLEDEEDGTVYYTDVICQHYNKEQGGCGVYSKRAEVMPSCIHVSVDNIASLNFMPMSCAYVAIAHGQDLPEWHPLKTGDKQSVHKTNNSVINRVYCETSVTDLESHIVSWPIEED